MMKRVHDENRENLEAVEATNAALVEVQVQLETQVDQLKAQAAAAAVPARRAAGLFAAGGAYWPNHPSTPFPCRWLAGGV